VSTIRALCGRKLIIPSDNLVGSTLDDRIRVVAFNGQDKHNKIYLTKNLSTDVYYEMRVYPFDEVGNKGKKILWRDCQKRRRSRRFLEVLKYEGKSLLLFHMRRVTFGHTTYLLGSGNNATEVERQLGRDNEIKDTVRKSDGGLFNLGDVMEFPPLPTGKQRRTPKAGDARSARLTDIQFEKLPQHLRESKIPPKLTRRPMQEYYM
jgi:hypothetical protein